MRKASAGPRSRLRHHGLVLACRIGRETPAASQTLIPTAPARATSGGEPICDPAEEAHGEISPHGVSVDDRGLAADLAQVFGSEAAERDQNADDGVVDPGADAAPLGDDDCQQVAA